MTEIGDRKPPVLYKQVFFTISVGR